MTRGARAIVLCTLMATVSLAAQQPPVAAPPDDGRQPRFRGGANLVRVDAYVMVDDTLVTDLSAEDFEVLEDNVPQRIESFELVRPRGPAPAATLREPNTVAESREMARDADARVFTLFLDLWHVQLDGSYRAQGPITRLLDRMIGQDDLIGVMTPDMSARNLTLARRPEAIDSILKDHWHWGQRERVNHIDPREREFERCYPDSGATEGVARQMTLRRRVGRTLDALEDLVVHLEGVREERKFVLLLSEGWVLGGPDQRLARPLSGGGLEAIPPMGVVNGQLRVDPDRGSGSYAACERERSMLAFTDHDSQFQQLLQRANRANVSFYPLDARGLVVFDEPIGPRRPLAPSDDARQLRDRHDTLRTLAGVTDGYAILDTNNIDAQLERLVQDTGAYYLLGYYSTNTRLDGRFRKLTVKVRRDGADVRARPGYLAPTEAELASARVDALMNGAAPGHTTIPPVVSRAFDALAPARASVPVRIHAAASRASIWITGELDLETFRSDEWRQGGQAHVIIEHERGSTPPMQVDAAVEAGQRAFTLRAPPGVALAAGRYVVRLQLTPAGRVLPVQSTADVIVPGPDDELSASGLVSRRGPTTGLEYRPTADARYRRTERIRFEVPRGGGAGPAAARLLGRDGQPRLAALTVSERVEPDSQQRLAVADLTLASLAQGEYVLEVSVGEGDGRATAAYAFRVVP